jgi:hypothetical protein
MQTKLRISIRNKKITFFYSSHAENGVPLAIANFEQHIRARTHSVFVLRWRIFIYWKKTGNMAEVQFGPPIKFTPDVRKIEQRLEKASE